MSRGPGPLQRRILQALGQYASLGKSLGWKWNSGRPYAAANYADDLSVQRHERGHYVHVWMLLRDLGCSKDELSRALKGLTRQGLASRLAGDLEVAESVFSIHKYCKFAAITEEGMAWLKRQQFQSGNVGA
jgi:hypothetical protein